MGRVSLAATFDDTTGVPTAVAPPQGLLHGQNTKTRGNGGSRVRTFEKHRRSARHSRSCPEARNPLGVHAIWVRGGTFLQELFFVCRAQLRLLRANHSWRETPNVAQQKAPDRFCEGVPRDGMGRGRRRQRHRTICAQHTRMLDRASKKKTAMKLLLEKYIQAYSP